MVSAAPSAASAHPAEGVLSAQESCPFCARTAGHQELLAESDLCAAFKDTTPLNPGHVLIVPRRHESDFVALQPPEINAILRMAIALRGELEREYRPDGFNLGVNVGDAAGQTVGHAHLHLIPRFWGDVGEPKGGIRWLIPDRARYWTADEPENPQ
jgi:diadenosine tetraphosphate (Ap4A) HIT family hydrolase